MDAHVLGIDLALNRTGVCDAIDRAGWIDTSDMTWRAKATTVIRWIALRSRPETLVVVEAPFLSRYRGVQDLIMLHGVFRAHLLDTGARWGYLTTQGLKKVATGKGNATKVDCQLAWYKRTGIELTDNNACDAAWLWVAGMGIEGAWPLDLPETHRAGIDKFALDTGE